MRKKQKKQSQNGNPNTPSKKYSEQPLRVLRGIWILGIALIAVWLIKIMIADSASLRANGYNPRVQQTEERFIRGALRDSAGRVLAETVTEEDTVRRGYPYGEACAHVTGYTGMGKTGLELAANEWLLQPAGFEEKWQQWFGGDKIRGCDVVTTLDAELQAYIYGLLNGYRGAVVVSDPSTGKVRALVSSPSFRPETVEADWDRISQDEASPLYARATQGLYPPGSTFKIVTALALYRTAADSFAYRYTCTGQIELGGSQLRCSHGLIHGDQCIREAFANSCNCFFAGLGVKLGGARLQQTADSLHIGRTFSFDLPQSTSSVRLDASPTEAMIAETAMGQGETLMTPLQLNMISSAIANQGIVYEPYLMDRVIDKNGHTVKKFLPQWYGALMTPEEAAYLEELMEGVVTIGTAPSLADARWQVYGKTGTAQVGEGIEDHSWFTGYARLGDRTVALTVLIENGGEHKKAVPVARKILEYLSEAGAMLE